MGIVYQAEDTLLNRAVAVKVLSGETTADGRQRLLREAQAAASLNHPNIVSIFDAGEMNGLPYIVMELVQGHRLHPTASWHRSNHRYCPSNLRGARSCPLQRDHPP